MGVKLSAISAQLDRIREKQRRLRELKINNSFSFRENTQEEFSRYIMNLPRDDPCKYATGIHGIVTLCNNSLFQCKYQGEPYKSLLKVPKKECKREKLAKIEGLFA